MIKIVLEKKVELQRFDQVEGAFLYDGKIYIKYTNPCVYSCFCIDTTEYTKDCDRGTMVEPVDLEIRVTHRKITN